ncbi:MAG: hypothetical protein EOM78_22345 [Erysipelotrichia bacterium]|nr:hypothetical protein [Erysipelotrichia bacterium]
MQIDKNKYQQKSKITSERQLILRDFIDKLNSERGKYPPVNPKLIAIKLSYLKTEELKVFYSLCKEAKHFSRYFWFATNVKNAK